MKRLVRRRFSTMACDGSRLKTGAENLNDETKRWARRVLRPTGFWIAEEVSRIQQKVKSFSLAEPHRRSDGANQDDLIWTRNFGNKLAQRQQSMGRAAWPRPAGLAPQPPEGNASRFRPNRPRKRGSAPPHLIAKNVGCYCAQARPVSQCRRKYNDPK